ncbi:MAG: hypothetical protein ACLVKO_02385 [Dysgonomonas sp.]
MERNNQTLKNIEYFIFNEKLIDLAHNGDYERLGRFKKRILR